VEFNLGVDFDIEDSVEYFHSGIVSNLV